MALEEIWGKGRAVSGPFFLAVSNAGIVSKGKIAKNK